MPLLSVQSLNEICKNTLANHLGIVITEVGDDFIKATMPVDNRTKQPYGLLHGGAVMSLAETLGGAGSSSLIDGLKFKVVGIEINGNHIGNTKCSSVYAVGKLIHKGRKTHVWNIEVYDEEKHLLSVCRLTNMILEKP
jgi:1,4-dihydroxy-2-naphthoyl-CoA hydrolase